MTTTPQLLRKNLHSVYTLCNECHTWGVNYPGSKECGNCGSFDTMVYYDEETVAQALQDQREGFVKEVEMMELSGRGEEYRLAQDHIIDILKGKTK